jgi:GrpE
MSVLRSRRDLVLACAFLGVLTGVIVYLLTGRPMVAVTALVGALVAAALPVLLIPTGAPASEPADPERTSLVHTCIYLRDRVTSTALASRLDQALAEVGVATVDPTGERFDPSHHEAGGTVATTDDGLVGTIAAVEAPGYADRGVLLRAPIVTVYQRRAS